MQSCTWPDPLSRSIMVYKLVCHGHHVVGTHHGATFTRLVALCIGQHLEWNEIRISNKAGSRWYSETGQWYSETERGIRKLVFRNWKWYSETEQGYSETQEWYSETGQLYSETRQWYSETQEWYSETGIQKLEVVFGN